MTFCERKNDKRKFHRSKDPMICKNLDGDNILTSNKISPGKKTWKYFIGYMNYDNEIIPLRICFHKPVHI